MDLLTALVADVVRLPPAMVRPRWQPTPPAQPTAGTPWAALGIVRRTAQGYTHQWIDYLPGTTVEALRQRRWATLEALVSFYGPDDADLAEQFRDGVQLVQNLQGLYAHGIRLTSVGDVQAVPDLVNLQWIDHQDVTLELVRQFDRYYPMRSLVRAEGTLSADVGYDTLLDSAQAAPTT